MVDSGCHGNIVDNGCHGNMVGSGCGRNMVDSGCDGNMVDSGCDGSIVDSSGLETWLAVAVVETWLIVSVVETYRPKLLNKQTFQGTLKECQIQNFDKFEVEKSLSRLIYQETMSERSCSKVVPDSPDL